MSVDWMRLAPTAAVLALVGYLWWSADEPTPPAPPKPRPQLSRQMFAFVPPPAPSLDPFRLQPPKPKAVNVKPTPGGAPASSKAPPPAGARAPAAGKRPGVQGLRLTGTSIGNVRLAVINNRIYAEGDRIRGAEGARPKDEKNPGPAGPSPFPGWVVAKVGPGRALLRRGVEEAELVFESGRPGKAPTSSRSVRTRP